MLIFALGCFLRIHPWLGFKGIGFDEALKRAETYLRAGADMLFIEAPQSEHEMRKICQTFEGVPLLANMVEAGKTPYLSIRELQEMGFKLAIFPISVLLVASYALNRALAELREHGKLSGATPIVDFKEFNQLMGLDEFLNQADKFS